MQKILLVDRSSMRQQFLLETLAELGEVVHFPSAAAARAAIERGMKVDAAVICFKVAAAPLIGTVRRKNPQAKIVAFGPTRFDLPLGVDQYLTQPMLNADLHRALTAA